MTRPPFPDLATTGPVHFIGIGGAGMSALAELVVRTGAEVTGCDLREGEATEHLAGLGVGIARGHDPSHLEGCAAVVYSPAVPSDHPELAAARSSRIPTLKRAQALGEWVNRGRVIAVAGSHGKTSTTALATDLLDAGGLDPTGLVGGRVRSWGSHLHLGSSDLYVVEGDEFDRSFHTLRPEVAVITNLEADHLEIYGDLDGVVAAFRTFVESVPREGVVLFCSDDTGASNLVQGLTCTIRSYGTAAGAQLRAEAVEWGGGCASFRIVEDGTSAGRFRIRAPGEHSVRNALGAVGVARWLGVSWEPIREALSEHAGVGRRFEPLGEVGGIQVLDDYAHHPSEIRATLQALRSSSPSRRVVAVFQPHLFTRTRDFASEFGTALAGADRAWVTDVYPAREEPIPGVTGEVVARAVETAGGSVTYHASLEGLARALAATLRPGDICVCMGAGSIEAVGPELVRELERGRAL